MHLSDLRAIAEAAHIHITIQLVITVVAMEP